MKPFTEVWDWAERIPGPITEAEAQSLYQFVDALIDDEAIVEVGTHRGKTTKILSSNGHFVTTVDVLDGDDDALCMATMRQVGGQHNVDWIKMFPEHVELPKVPIGLLVIDGSKRPGRPLNDFHHFLPAMADGGHVAFRGYGVHGSVTECVDRLADSGRGEIVGLRETLIVVRITTKRVPRHERLTTVTGFDFVCLCHHWSRRGSMFLQSLMTQQIESLPVKTQLTVFFARTEDEVALVKAMRDCDADWDAISLRRLPDSMIMRRPLAFASYTPRANASHVVFCDCDLWMPPDFLSDYAKFLEQKRRGYWSSVVWNVPQQSAEDLLAIDRRQFSEKIVRSMVNGEPQWNSSCGRAGVFQCVPRGLANYPAVDVASVAKVDDQFARQAIDLSHDQRQERRIGNRYIYHFDHDRAWEGTTKEF